jgi:hypothetical protein
VGKIRPIAQSAADVIAPAIAISEQTIIEVDQQNSFLTVIISCVSGMAV